MAEDLLLDTKIRNWVLVPLTVAMLLIRILRYFVSKLMRSSQSLDAKTIKGIHVILRAKNLRASANFIPLKSFLSRRLYFSNEENGLLHVPKEDSQNANTFFDTDKAFDMVIDKMRNNLKMIIPQSLLFAWMNFFFSGFTVAKIPFSVTQKFRSMLQNGIDLSNVDVRYVSSFSWYVLNMFGLSGFFSLIIEEEKVTNEIQKIMQISGSGFDPLKMFGAEKGSLDIIQHEWVLPEFERRAAAVLKKLIN